MCREPLRASLRMLGVRCPGGSKEPPPRAPCPSFSPYTPAPSERRNPKGTRRRDREHMTFPTVSCPAIQFFYRLVSKRLLSSCSEVLLQVAAGALVGTQRCKCFLQIVRGLRIEVTGRGTEPQKCVSPSVEKRCC